MTKFHFQWDASVSNAPAAFPPMVEQVGADIAAMCPNPVDVTIQAGWGTILDSPLDPGALGESAANGGSVVTFASLRAALLRANPTFVLPTTDPNPTGAPYSVNPATAKALGLAPNGTGLDGWIGFSATNGVLSFDRSNLNGQFDAYGVIFHEITEILGRSLNVSFNSLSPLDLFHYSGLQQPIFTMTRGYFSTDGGATVINTFNTVSGGDAGDWAGDTLDPCNAVGTSGVLENPSSADWAVLKALAFMSQGTQAVPLNTAMTAPLTFKDKNGKVGPGPIGKISASNGSPISLSSNGQAVNFKTGTSPQNVTVLWQDPSGKLPDMTRSLAVGVSGLSISKNSLTYRGQRKP